MHFFASAAKGTEPALRDELRRLRFRAVRADRGGVHFEGDWQEGYRACLWSRVALRVLSPLASFEAAGERALYAGVRELDLDFALGGERTLVVSAACRSSRLTHTQYVSQLTKDAVVDRIRERSGTRPNVDKRDADVHLFVHLVKDRATVYIDLAGEPLHRRGYRDPSAEAPLRETLASALIVYSGWDLTSPLCDPLCGSGTILIEAALAARNVAPGLSRQRFGFERWAGFGPRERDSMQELRRAAKAAERACTARIIGRDVAPQALQAARASARRAGVDLDLALGSLRELRAPAPAGSFVTNPPYGHRLDRGPELQHELVQLVDENPSWNAALLLPAEDDRVRTERRPSSVRQVFNGDIECVVRCYSAVAPRDG